MININFDFVISKNISTDKPRGKIMWQDWEGWDDWSRVEFDGPLAIYKPKDNRLEWTWKDNIKQGVETTYHTHVMGEVDNNRGGHNTFTQQVANVHTVEEYVNTTVTVSYIGDVNIGVDTKFEFDYVAPNLAAMHAKAKAEVYAQAESRCRRKITITDMLLETFCPEVIIGRWPRGVCGSNRATSLKSYLCNVVCLPWVAVVDVVWCPCAYCRASDFIDRKVEREADRLANILTKQRVDEYWNNKIADALREVDNRIERRILAMNRTQEEQTNLLREQNSLLRAFQQLNMQQHSASSVMLNTEQTVWPNYPNSTTAPRPANMI